MLIGLHGKAGSGKDQSYEFIRRWAESERLPVRREAFADRLKLSAARALGFVGDLPEAVEFCNDLKESCVVGFATLDDNDEPVNPMALITGREYLQYYGTEAHREVFGMNFWIESVMSTYEPGELLVVTDVRFINEAAAIDQAGGEVWHLVRPDHEIAGDTHASEQPLPTALVDRVIINDRGLEHLRGLVISNLELVLS